jgi:hypothetical protein
LPCTTGLASALVTRNCLLVTVADLSGSTLQFRSASQNNR